MTDWGRLHQYPQVEPPNAAPDPGPPAPPTFDGPPPPEPPALEIRELFEQHFSYVWHTLRRLGVPDPDLEDLAHDVFLEVHRRRAEYEHGRPVRAWLFGFAFRVASHDRRRARRRHEVPDDASERVALEPSALDRVIAAEALEVARLALAGLEINQRAVFLMHEVDGFSIPEVAEALGVPLNTAYSRLRLARQEFRRQIARLRKQRGEP